jgi:hypothetical protein
MTGLVREEAERVKQLLEDFVDAHVSAVPSEAQDAVHRFRMEFPTTGDLQAVAQLRLIAIRLHAELSYFLADVEEHVVQLTERAFLHLQRSIVADEDLQRKWCGAFDRGELSCERLGSVHLLSHGVWGFKASATGERTDLILGERLVVDDRVRRSAVGMTLTEWKLVRPGDKVERAQATAIAQANRYAAGSLAGFEVQTTRFVVIVSQTEVHLPQTVSAGDITYRIVNIAVKPSTPSAAARVAHESID